jgi:glycosyltransferase involved in cell wall biosynthesis
VGLTVYIPCFNAEAYIEGSIRSLLAQTRPPDEILVIDDGSTDRSVELASKFPVRVIRHERNRGLAAARNTAIANASHELVGAIDADVFAKEDWLERLLSHFGDDRVVGTGGRLIEQFQETPADSWRAIHLCQDLGEQRIDIEWPSHRCLGGFGTILRKHVVKDAGGYNETYRTNFEDVDMCARLVRAGHMLTFEPLAIAYHQRRDNIRSVVRTAWRWEFYTHYFHGGYNNIWLKLLFNFRLARVLAWQHIRMGRPGLLAVDSRLPWVHSRMDLQYHFSPSRLPHFDAPPELSAVYLPRPFRPPVKGGSVSARRGAPSRGISREI